MKELMSLLGWRGALDIVRDAMDIVFVSVVIYWLLVIVKGTRAVQMLIGLGLLLLVSVLARHIPLYTLDWILSEFWAYIVIAIVVVFQPELRRTLAKMGEAPFLYTFTSAEELRGMEEIVRASVSLANKKIGALIVIERDTDLKDFIELGTPLDARITRELLMSVFHPTSPIHDGAVVIRGNRAVAAGCFLPIAASPTISPTLGTRHRAALGISEETDCVVIIVSEETGFIAMAMNGHLDTHIDMGTLRDKLTEIFTERTRQKRAASA